MMTIEGTSPDSDNDNNLSPSTTPQTMDATVLNNHQIELQIKELSKPSAKLIKTMFKQSIIGNLRKTQPQQQQIYRNSNGSDKDKDKSSISSSRKSQQYDEQFFEAHSYFTIQQQQQTQHLSRASDAENISDDTDNEQWQSARSSFHTTIGNTIDQPSVDTEFTKKIFHSRYYIENENEHRKSQASKEIDENDNLFTGLINQGKNNEDICNTSIVKEQKKVCHYEVRKQDNQRESQQKQCQEIQIKNSSGRQDPNNIIKNHNLAQGTGQKSNILSGILEEGSSFEVSNSLSKSNNTNDVGVEYNINYSSKDSNSFIENENKVEIQSKGALLKNSKNQKTSPTSSKPYKMNVNLCNTSNNATSCAASNSQKQQQNQHIIASNNPKQSILLSNASPSSRNGTAPSPFLKGISGTTRCTADSLFSFQQNPGQPQLNLSQQQQQFKAQSFFLQEESLDLSSQLNQSFLQIEERENNQIIQQNEQLLIQLNQQENLQYYIDHAQSKPTKQLITHQNTDNDITPSKTLSLTQLSQQKIQLQQQQQQPQPSLIPSSQQLNYLRSRQVKLPANWMMGFSNRILELKGYSKSEHISKREFMKHFTINLAYILSVQIAGCSRSRQMFNAIIIMSILMRVYFYFFSAYLMAQDSQYLLSLLGLVLGPRLLYILAMTKAIFFFQNQPRGYRLLSQIFNNAFGSDGYFQLMNMNQLLTSEHLGEFTTQNALARIIFIVVPVEFSRFVLRNRFVLSSKKQEAWLFASYVLASIEFMLVYTVMIFFSIFNKVFQDHYVLTKKLSLNLFTLSFTLFISTLSVFLIFSIYFICSSNYTIKQQIMKQQQQKHHGQVIHQKFQQISR